MGGDAEGGGVTDLLARVGSSGTDSPLDYAERRKRGPERDGWARVHRHSALRQDVPVPRKSDWDFGCDDCRDDSNRFYGHLDQIGSNADRGMILLRCPRCNALYEDTPAGPDQTLRLTGDEAHTLYPGSI